MEPYIRKYFSQLSDEQSAKSYYKLIVLHDTPDISWDDVSGCCRDLPKGWYELSRVQPKDRIEFCRDYWIATLPYHPKAVECITAFFDRVADIGIVLAQRHFNDPFEVHKIYALKEDAGFFHGSLPISEEGLQALSEEYPDTIFPADYLAFLKIHDGFSKSCDSGIIPTRHFKELNERFHSLVHGNNPPLTTKGQTVNPHSLIPFYESFGMPYFQCFWKDWYPQQEMGNVYYSGAAHTISDPADMAKGDDAMAFETFLDWLFFYLEAPF